MPSVLAARPPPQKLSLLTACDTAATGASPRPHVQHVLTAAGANIIRLSDCFRPGTTPDRPPRQTCQFQRLCRELPG